MSPRALAAPGFVTFSWTSQAVSSCVLVDGAGDVRAAGTDATVTFEVTESGTFEVVCQSDQGVVSDRASVVVGPAVTALRAFTDAAADHLTLGWTAENVTRCALTVDNNNGTLTLDNLAPRTAVGAADFPIRQAARGATFDLPLPLVGAGDTTVTLACDDGGGGVATDSVVVGEPAQAVIHTLQATPLALPAGGGDVDVCWSASGSELCGYYVVTMNETFIREGSVPPTGCLSTTDGLLPLTETARFLFGCGGVIGNANAEILIPVGPYVIDFSSTPTDLTAPGTAILAWDAVNVDACSVLDADGSEVATGAASDSTAVVLDEGAFFTLDCDNGAVTEEIYVAVGPTIIELSVEPTEDRLGFVYSFRSALVTSCEMRVTGEDGYAHPIRSTPDLGCTQSCGESWWWEYARHGAPTVRVVCAADDGGTVERSVTGAVPTLGPFATFQATPDWQPTGGGDVEVCWSAPDADTCSLDGLPVAVAGCETRAVEVETWSSLTCANDNGVTDRTLRMLVGPSIRSFTVDRTVALRG